MPSRADVQLGVFAEPNGAIVGEPTEVPSWLRRYPDPVTDLQVEGEHVRVVSVPARIHGITVAWVVAGRSVVAEDRLLHRVRLLLMLGGALAILASLVAGWLLAGRAVRPVELAYDAQAGFAADASHELRTPLTFVRQGVEVLAAPNPELGAEVLSEVDYLTGITQRLLQLARAEGGEVEFDAEPVDAGEVARACVRRSRQVHGNELTAEGDETAALADPVALGAVLDGLLENVARHGGGSADVTWRRDGREVVIAVADHGPGIPEQLQAHAFDRFFRADPSRARDTGGAGLGLALARALVGAMGGRIWLEPTPGGGLTVSIGLRTA